MSSALLLFRKEKRLCLIKCSNWNTLNFWSVSLENFIKHKSFFSEESIHVVNSRFTNQLFWSKNSNVEKNYCCCFLDLYLYDSLLCKLFSWMQEKDISLFNSFVITFQIFLSITPFLAWHGKLLKFCQNKTSIIEKAG